MKFFLPLKSTRELKKSPHHPTRKTASLMEWHTGKRRSGKKEKCKILDKNTGKPGF